MANFRGIEFGNPLSPGVLSMDMDDEVERQRKRFGIGPGILAENADIVVTAPTPQELPPRDGTVPDHALSWGGDDPGFVSTQTPSLPPKRKSHAFDKDNLSDTLLMIGSGLLSSQNFGEGLAKAGQGILAQNRRIRDENRTTTTYGGPDGLYKIETDGLGNEKRTLDPQAMGDLERIKTLKEAPAATDRRGILGSVAYSIGQLPPEQQQTAWANVRSQPGLYGLTAADIPENIDATTQNLLAGSALTVDQGMSHSRNNAATAANIEAGRTRAQASLIRANKPPSGGRRASPARPRSNTIQVGQRMGGYIFNGGNPKDRANWSKE